MSFYIVQALHYRHHGIGMGTCMGQTKAWDSHSMGLRYGVHTADTGTCTRLRHLYGADKGIWHTTIMGQQYEAHIADKCTGMRIRYSYGTNKYMGSTLIWGNGWCGYST
eukprot:1160146-Pelagomonas_calceolata.AAC.16